MSGENEPVKSGMVNSDRRLIKILLGIKELDEAGVTE